MSQASSPRAVLRLAWPIGVSMISFALKGVVDMLMVGRLGPIALAGVGFAQIAAWMAFTFPWGMLRGQRPLVSQYHGAGDSQASFAFGVQGFYLGAIWGCLLFSLAWIAKGFLEGVAGTTALDPEACSLAGEYLKWRLVFALPTILAFAVAEYQRSLERTRIPMLVDIVTHPLNVLFNWALIFGNLGLPALGAKGAAIGTGLADLCALAFLLWKVRPANPLPWKALAFRWNRMKAVLSVGITGGIQFTLENLSFAVISYMVAFLGTLSVAVNQAGISLIHLSLMPAIAIGDGGSVLIGKFIGERRWDEAARTLRSMLAILVPFMGAMGVVYLLAGRWLVKLYINEDDPVLLEEALALGAGVMTAIALFQLGDALQVAYRFALRAAGDHHFVMRWGILVAWLLSAPLSWVVIFALGGNLAHVWYAWAVESWVGGLIFALRWKGGAWKTKRLVRVEAPASPMPGGEVS